MRKAVFDSAWFHYGLLVLLLAGATSGGLILLGCLGQDANGTQVVEPDQRDGDGGVYFDSQDPRTEARVIVSPSIADEEVNWYVPKGQPYLEIRDPKNCNQITILRPPDNVRKTTVTVEGDFTKNGATHHVARYIHVTNAPKL
jgi:hypothetical protein